MSIECSPQFGRREMLRNASCGFGHLALMGMLASESQGDPSGRILANPLLPRAPHFVPRAKRIIMLFMQGGMSHIDTFDPKPMLTKRDGEKLPFEKPLGFNRNDREDIFLLRSPWSFRQWGESGLPVSELFPRVARHVDDLCFVRSMSHDLVDHARAILELHTGDGVFVRPSMGSWIMYGLGSENDNLPGFISICPTGGSGGHLNYGSAFLPAHFQGTRLGQATGRGQPRDAARATFRNIRPLEPNRALQRLQLDALRARNRRHLASGGNPTDLEARIASYELAFLMQMAAPALMDLSRESPATLAQYGVGSDPTDNFGRQCLMARRFSEAGVRFVQATQASKWDQHDGLKQGHEIAAREIDQPIAALLTDLKQRGLWEETLVIGGTEFGRTPVAQSKDGRDHNPYGYTLWLAGGAVKSGMAYGSTDEFGYFAVEDKTNLHDLHATLLHLLGIDHTRLTYRHAGREFRLTDIEGRVLYPIVG